MNNISQKISTKKRSLSPFFVLFLFVFLFADDAFIMDNKEKKEIK